MNYKDVLKKIEPFLVLGVFLLLFFNAYSFYQSNELQKEVAETTGWEKGEVRCFCEKSKVIEMENSVDGIDSVNFVFNSLGSE